VELPDFDKEINKPHSENSDAEQKKLKREIQQPENPADSRCIKKASLHK
jgi:hypothetical protein